CSGAFTRSRVGHGPLASYSRIAELPPRGRQRARRRRSKMYAAWVAAGTRLASASLLAIAVGCAHDHVDSPGPATGAISVGLPNGSRVDTLAVGEQVQVSLTWRNGESSDRVEWSSDSPSVATLSSTGLVTALPPGSATVSAASGASADTVQIIVTRPVS